MSIETTLERIATALERFAAQLPTSAAAPAAAVSTPAAEPVPPAQPAKKPGRPPKKTEDELVNQAQANERAKVEAAETPFAPATRETVAGVIQQFLTANRRNDVVSLLKQYKAESLSALPEDQYGHFVHSAKILLDMPTDPLA